MTHNDKGLRNDPNIQGDYISVRDNRQFRCGTQFHRQGPHPELWTKSMLSRHPIDQLSTVCLTWPCALKYGVEGRIEGNLDDTSIKQLIETMSAQTFKLDDHAVTDAETTRQYVSPEQLGQRYYYAAADSTPIATTDDQAETPEYFPPSPSASGQPKPTSNASA